MEPYIPEQFNFNPLRREGGDKTEAGKIQATFDFNPLRREGGDSFSRGRQPGWKNFNPLRREGGDFSEGFDMDEVGSISIHSAARAETTVPGYRYMKVKDFNPLRREGGDPLLV